MILYLTVFVREDKGDQILDYTEEIQTMEEQLKKLQKEVNTQLQNIDISCWYNNSIANFHHIHQYK